MKFSCIFVITFWCTIYISDNSAAVKLPTDESFIKQPVQESSNGIIEENSETDTSDMQRKGKSKKPKSGISTVVKLPIDENSVIQLVHESSNDIIEENSETETSDMQRRGKPKKPTSVRNCLDLKKQGKRSGTYLITPCDDTPSKVVAVSCDMDTDGGGWTVIQRRDNYPEQRSFYNTWNEYSIGFGDVSRDFWLGNDNIHCLTKQSYNELRFDLEDFDGNTRYAVYGFFYIGDETDLYKLSTLNYHGNAGDSFTHHNNMNFSTYDADHESDSRNCASTFTGAWWYKGCHYSNLNGVYNDTTFGKGLNWYHWLGHNYSLKKTEMKIRPTN